MTRDLIALCAGRPGRPKPVRYGLKLLGAVALALSSQWATAAGTEYQVGVGKAGMSGILQGTPTSGYAKLYQREGFFSRQNARAFIVFDKTRGKRLVIVVGEFLSASQAVHQELLKRLRIKGYGRWYNEENLIITGTHTHSGPNGFSTYMLDGGTENKQGSWTGLFEGGVIDPMFHPLTFEAHVTGLLEAIMNAHNNLRDGNVDFAYTTTDDSTPIAYQRSQKAYLRNPKTEIDLWEVDGKEGHQKDLLLRVLKFSQLNGSVEKEVGMLAFYAVHPTAQPAETPFVSSDLMGYAANKVERTKGKDYVAAFANTNTGDLTTRLIDGPAIGDKATPPDMRDWYSVKTAGLENVKRFGELLAAPTLSLLAQTRGNFTDQKFERLTGPVRSRMQYVNMVNYQVDKQYTKDGNSQITCAPRVGLAMFAGSEEGPGNIPWRGGNSWNLKDKPQLDPQWDRNGTVRTCHYPKAILANSGILNAIGGVVGNGDWPAPSTLQMGFDDMGNQITNDKPGNLEKESHPHILPVTVARIGNFALGTFPGEATTMVGRQARRQIAKSLNYFRPTGVTADISDSVAVKDAYKRVVALGYTNAYAGYTTTWDEYQEQEYEGGHTIFGPNQQAAFLQAHANLAKAVLNDSLVDRGSAPWCRLCTPPYTAGVTEAGADNGFWSGGGAPYQAIFPGSKPVTPEGTILSQGFVGDSYDFSVLGSVLWWSTLSKRASPYFTINRCIPKDDKNCGNSEVVYTDDDWVATLRTESPGTGVINFPDNQARWTIRWKVSDADRGDTKTDNKNTCYKIKVDGTRPVGLVLRGGYMPWGVEPFSASSDVICLGPINKTKTMTK